MKQDKKLLCVLLAILFLTMPLGINALIPIERTATTEAPVVASDNGYDFVKRNQPVSVWFTPSMLICRQMVSGTIQWLIC